MVLLPVSTTESSLDPPPRPVNYRYTDNSDAGTSLIHSNSLHPSPAQALLLAVLAPISTARQAVRATTAEMQFLVGMGAHQTQSMLSTLVDHSTSGAPHSSWSWDFHLTLRAMRASVTIPGNTLARARAPQHLAKYLPVPRDVHIQPVDFSVNKPQLLRPLRESEEWFGVGVDGWNLPIDIGPPLYDLTGEWIDCRMPKSVINDLDNIPASTSLLGGMVRTLVNPRGFLTNFLNGHLPPRPSSKVIYYLHGGAYSLMSVKTHRAITCRLARLTGARVFALEYRLAPEHPFPAALLDAFAGWIYLTTHHAGIPETNPARQVYRPEDVVVMGDSAGGGLCVALMSLLKDWIKSEDGTPRFGMPRAACLMSPWVDLTCSHPSWEENTKYDYLPGKSGTLFETLFEDGSPNPVAGYLWGMEPDLERKFWVESRDYDLESAIEREECANNQVMHPLVSPLYCNLEGMPPMLIQAGECELLRDETISFAKKLIEVNGSGVRHEIYTGMPHVFQAVR
jgi:acetyl esterase/lipase